jgi:hypothetical protein
MRVRRMFGPIKNWELYIWGSFHRPRIFPFLLRVPCRLPCRQLIVPERIQMVLNFTLCLTDLTLMTLACSRDFMARPLTGDNGPNT